MRLRYGKLSARRLWPVLFPFLLLVAACGGDSESDVLGGGESDASATPTGSQVPTEGPSEDEAGDSAGTVDARFKFSEEPTRLSGEAVVDFEIQIVAGGTGGDFALFLESSNLDSDPRVRPGLRDNGKGTVTVRDGEAASFGVDAQFRSVDGAIATVLVENATTGEVWLGCCDSGPWDALLLPAWTPSPDDLIGVWFISASNGLSVELLADRSTRWSGIEIDDGRWDLGADGVLAFDDDFLDDGDVRLVDHPSMGIIMYHDTGSRLRVLAAEPATCKKWFTVIVGDDGPGC